MLNWLVNEKQIEPHFPYVTSQSAPTAHYLAATLFGMSKPMNIVVLQGKCYAKIGALSKRHEIKLPKPI